MSPSLSIVRKTGAALALALTPILLMYGCKDASKEDTAARGQGWKILPPCTPRSGPRRNGRFEKDAAIEEKVAALLKKMTVEEKVGQVIQGDICCIKPADMKQYHLGSILAGGGSSPGRQRTRPGEGLAEARRRFLRRLGRHQQWRRRASR